MKTAMRREATGKRRSLKFFCLALFAMLPAFCVAAQAQNTTRIPVIGYLSAPPLSVSAGRLKAFRQGLRELGYMEGKNIIIEWRSAEGKSDRLPALAAEFVRLNVRLIVTGGGAATHAAKEATSTIPMVMAQDPDPVANGFVASLAHPGGNITGLSTYAPELSGKRLDILKQVVPKLSRVAVLGTSTYPGNAQVLEELEASARAFGVKLQPLDVLNSRDIESALRAARNSRAEGVVTLNSPVLSSQRTQLIDLAVKTRLPVIYHQSRFVEEGGLIYYGVNLLELDRRSATYVDKILKGTKPADLPVEQPTKFELVINLNAAKQIGLTIPPNVLARADRVIR
jgi:putative ABC transport system substrate-binding protein